MMLSKEIIDELKGICSLFGFNVETSEIGDTYIEDSTDIIFAVYPYRKERIELDTSWIAVPKVLWSRKTIKPVEVIPYVKDYLIKYKEYEDEQKSKSMG